MTPSVLRGEKCLKDATENGRWTQSVHNYVVTGRWRVCYRYLNEWKVQNEWERVQDDDVGVLWDDDGTESMGWSNAHSS